MSDDNKVVITCPVTGSMGDASTPFLPITPRQIADSALEAGRAGAAAVHIHVRDPETGTPSMDPALYREAVRRIRDNSDLIINLSTGAGGRFIPDDGEPIGRGPGSTLCSPEKRVEHVLELKPEICSLDVGSLNFGPHVFVNTKGHVERMADLVGQIGVKPEMEVFDLGHCRIANDLIAKGLAPADSLFQICLGVPWGAAATSENMIALRRELSPESIWAGFGIAAGQFPMVAQAVVLGGHVRVGMEDNLYLAKGVRAKSNAELVAKAVEIIRLLGKEIAAPDEARRILKLN